MFRKREATSKANWSEKYGEKHRLCRIQSFPEGITPPKRVRIYWRKDHYVLQVWDPSLRKTVSDRVDGDLLSALTKARQIEERLITYKRTGVASRQMKHEDFIARYIDHLHLRADAGEIDERTVRRYETALRHYRAFITSADCRGLYPFAHQVDRSAVLRLSGFLASRQVSANGRQSVRTGPMKSQHFVLGVIRAMYAWGTDLTSGPLLGKDFVNPFLGLGRLGPARVAIDMTRELAITKEMAEEFLLACDDWQFRLFSTFVLFGLRASEPIFLFRESLGTNGLHVVCYPELDYLTKGRRNKRFPILASFANLRVFWMGERSGGLLFRRRSRDSAESESLDVVINRFQQACRSNSIVSARQRRRLRDSILREAGALDYDGIEQEFRTIASKLGWPRSATLRGFRHLFSTVLENAGMPEYYRRYFMGQSAGRAPIVTYTHLDQLDARLEEAFEREWPSLFPLVEKTARHHLSNQPSTARLV